MVVAGISPCSRVNVSSEAVPPASGSMSRIKSPDRSPVGIPMFASGQRFHHAVIRLLSVVAFAGQSLISDLFSPDRIGNTGVPRFAYLSAALCNRLRVAVFDSAVWWYNSFCKSTPL